MYISSSFNIHEVTAAVYNGDASISNPDNKDDDAGICVLPIVLYFKKGYRKKRERDSRPQ